MAATWKHPKLGSFKFERSEWFAKVKAPGFDAFKYDEFGNARPNGKYPMLIEAEDEDDTPGAEQVEVALQVLKDPEKLVVAICDAFWEEFHGRGPKSGMWWYGGMKDVVKQTGKLKNAKQLLSVMNLAGIYVMKPQKPVLSGINPFTGKKIKMKPRPALPAMAELDFDAAFEREHGVGVLTDGVKVLGTGYSAGDVRPYEVGK